MEVSKRRRGRPRKRQSNSSEPSVYEVKSELEETRAKIRYFVDSQENMSFYQLGDVILPRSQCPITATKEQIQQWEAENAAFAQLLEYNESLTKKLQLFSEYPGLLVASDSSESSDDDEEDEEECQEDKSQPTPPKNSRTSYLQVKAPIKAFDTQAFNNLPAEAQNILQSKMEEIFDEKITYQAQVEKVISLIYSSERGSGTGPAAIGKLFGVSRGTISAHYKRMSGIRRELVGRPATFDSCQMRIIEDLIRMRFIEHHSPNYQALADFIFNKLNLTVSTDTLRKIIDNSKIFKTVTAIPMESIRADAPLDEIIEYYKRLSGILEVHDIPPAFVFNVDECGFQEFVDAHQQVVVVPADICDDEVVYSVNRESKRATLIGCIGMDGTTLLPLVVSPNMTVEKQLIQNGYNQSNVLIVSQENGFVTSHLFAFWADHVLFPEIQKRRALFNYSGEALIMMDGCTSHLSDYFLDECTYQSVIIMKEPAGTSDQVQALDLGIFGLQKTMKCRVDRRNNLSETSKNIQTIVDSWRKATTPSNVVSAFNQAGLFTIEKGNGDVVARASIEFARAIRGVEHRDCANIITGRKTIDLKRF